MSNMTEAQHNYARERKPTANERRSTKHKPQRASTNGRKSNNIMTMNDNHRNVRQSHMTIHERTLNTPKT